VTAPRRVGRGKTKKQRYLYRKKLLRRQEFSLRQLGSPGSDDAKAAARDQARELANRMVKHGLADQCLLLDLIVEEIMRS
jgi:hypothetical protein